MGKAESKPKPTPKPKKNSKKKPIPNPNPELLNSNTDSNDYSASNLIEMKPMHNEDWFALNNDNIDYEWRQLCSIDLDPDLKHHIDLNETQHGPDLAKPKTMHIVKINDWFTMNNDNIDIEWRRLNMINIDNEFDLDLDKDHDSKLNTTNPTKPKTMHNVKLNDWFTMNNDNIDIGWRRLNMINLEYDHDIDLDLENDSDTTTFEWNRLNMVYFDTLDPHSNLVPELHNEALRKISRMRTNRIDGWLIVTNRNCNIRVENISLTNEPHGIDTPLVTLKPSPVSHIPSVHT